MVEVSPLESYRRRRRPVRVRRRYVRRPPTRRRTVRPPRLRVRTPYRRRRTARVVPRRRRLPTVRRRPIRVVRRYIPLPYPGYRRLDLPPAAARVRPAAIHSHFSVDSATLRPHHMPPIEQVARHVREQVRLYLTRPVLDPQAEFGRQSLPCRSQHRRHQAVIVVIQSDYVTQLVRDDGQQVVAH